MANLKEMAGALFKKAGSKGAVLASPLTGAVVPLEKVKDEAFASGALGKGAAILPEAGLLCSPADGLVDSITEAKHAVTIVADNGAEILMHIGMDTVGLKGAPFTPKVSEGQRVKAGDPLIAFDIEAIKAAGLDTATPVVVANSDEFASIEITAGGRAVQGEPFITIKR
jgi:glucose-specific phosphotransferase system IIA component